jgi:hypothetical protein
MLVFSYWRLSFCFCDLKSNALLTYPMPAAPPFYPILLDLFTVIRFDGQTVARKAMNLLHFEFLRCGEVNVMPSPTWQ